MDSFIKWMGGKRRMRQEIIGMIPAHKTYCEVFGGAGWVLFGKPPSPVEVYNDIEGQLVNLWLTVRDKPHEFAGFLEGIPLSEALFKRWGEWYTSGGILEPGVDGIPLGSYDVESAAKFYYLLMNSFNGKVSERPVYSIGAGKESAYLRFYNTDWERVANRLKRVHILQRNYDLFLEAVDSPETLFYLDPPYLCATDNTEYYRHSFSLEDHARLRVMLEDLEGRFILSYGDNPKIWELYGDVFTVCRSNVKPGELLITNFEPPEKPFYRLEDQAGIPSAPGYSGGGGIPSLQRNRAPWDIPNCPRCQGRNVTKRYKRFTKVIDRKKKRSWGHDGFGCDSCGYMFRGAE